MKDRNSGYTTMTSIGSRRGDNTSMVKMSLVNMPENLSLESGKEYTDVKKAPKAKAPAAKKAVVAKAEAKKPVKAVKKAAPAKKAAVKGKK
jgi:large subunit ribosomal protein L17